MTARDDKSHSLARAAELLRRYASVVKDCHSHELERFDYLPEIEECAEAVEQASRSHEREKLTALCDAGLATPVSTTRQKPAVAWYKTHGDGRQRVDLYPDLERWMELEGWRVQPLYFAASATPRSEPVGWVLAVKDGGYLSVRGPQYHTREAAEQDATLPRARGLHAEIWECFRSSDGGKETNG